MKNTETCRWTEGENNIICYLFPTYEIQSIYFGDNDIGWAMNRLINQGWELKSSYCEINFFNKRITHIFLREYDPRRINV